MEIKENIDNIVKLLSNKIGKNDQAFIKRIYNEGLTKYINRLKAIGFAGCNNVLDAGCGYGQWSLSLSALNNKINSCDISPIRIEFANKLSHQKKINNITFQVSGLDNLPYEDNSFDAIFCYGVIFLTDWHKSLSELSRVLKRGGLLYLNANGAGWYNFLWNDEHNKTDDYDPRKIAANSYQDTLNYERTGVYKQGMNLIIDSNDLNKELVKNNFSNIDIASEGCLHTNKNEPEPESFFKGQYYGQMGIYEILASKL